MFFKVFGKRIYCYFLLWERQNFPFLPECLRVENKGRAPWPFPGEAEDDRGPVRKVRGRIRTGLDPDPEKKRRKCLYCLSCRTDLFELVDLIYLVNFYLQFGYYLE